VRVEILAGLEGYRFACVFEAEDDWAAVRVVGVEVVGVCPAFFWGQSHEVFIADCFFVGHDKL
jgi:hypothetical protein